MPEPRPVLFDVNALLALSLTTHQHHRAAHRFLSGIAGQWATCPITESALYRLLLNPAVTGSSRRPDDVTVIVRGMRSDPRWTFLEDASSLAQPTVDTTILVGHQQVTDLHLINLAASRGLVLASFDAAIPTWLARSDRQHVTIIPS